MADIFNIAGRIHSTSQEEVALTANEVLDTTQGKKQSAVNSAVQSDLNGVHDDLDGANGLQGRVATLEAQVAFDGDFQAENTAEGITTGSGKIVTANAARGAIDVRTGYFVCGTEAATAAKAVTAGGFVLTGGGAIKIKMTNANTAASGVTLNINSTDPKTIYYNGEAVNASNTWEAGEVVEVYYDPSANSNAGAYYANNVAGGAGDGVFDLTAKTGDSYATLSAALTAASTAIPANKKKGGMSIKYVQTSDNKYVQYRLTSDSFSSAVFNWREINDIYSNNSLGSEDLNLSDENGYMIVMFKNGHIKTKNFDSSRDATISKRGLMSAEDKEKLNSIEEGAEVNATGLTNSLGSEDLNIADEEGYMIAMFKGGHIKTKNFDSSEQPQLANNNVNQADLDFVDENRNIILSVLNGYPITKNFSGKRISENIDEILAKIRVTEWGEEWSKMPSLYVNPLEKVRFDGGMCRIFRKWGFIGDSLCSGTMNGYVVSELSYTEIQNKAISEGAIVDDNTSTVSDNVTLVGRYPAIKMIFQSNSGLNGKVLLASYTNGTYTPLITGGTAKEYQNIVIPNDSVIAVSYPSSNVPRILLSVDRTQQANYDMSWGQQLCRLINAEGYNFSIGGEYAKRWCVGGAGGSSNRNWEKAQQIDELKDVYVIGLGVNDRAYWFNNQINIVDYPCVTAYPNVADYAQSFVLSDSDVMSDVDLTDYTQNANSYAGWYAGIIQRIKSVRKDAYIFCCTLPDSLPSDASKAYSQVVRKLVEKLNVYYGDNTIWLIDFEQYNPITSEIRQNIYNSSHLTAFGYLYYAYQITSYIDWVIRNNVSDFKNVPFIGTTTVAERFDEFKIQ